MPGIGAASVCGEEGMMAKGMTVQEAGRLGGKKVASERGHEFYEEIGRKGGAKVAAEYGPAFYSQIGKLGGELGGRKGGETVRDRYGHGFYEEIGRKGGQKVRELIAKGKKTTGNW
jgi:general stress protein YciG